VSSLSSRSSSPRSALLRAVVRIAVEVRVDVRFVPELIHNRSGVGSMIQVADLNKDGAVDIMAGTNRGGFIFWGTRARGARGSASPPAAPSRK